MQLKGIHTSLPVFQQSRAISVPVSTPQNTSQKDTFEPKFSGKRTVASPGTIAESKFQNDRVNIDSSNPLGSLVERLDEIMTVTGEAYSGNEAFTTLIDIKLHDDMMARSGETINASVNAQVDQTLNVGKAANIGIMVMTATANDVTGGPMATSRAAFNAIDPASVSTGKLVPKPVTNLTLSVGDQGINQAADDWNKKYAGFYKALATRLGVGDPNALAEDVQKLQSSDTRLVNTNVYVTPQMLNKKRTGHGGVAAAMALKDMNTLANKYIAGGIGGSSWSTNEGFISDFTASYREAFNEKDALSFDTTVDNVDKDGHVFMSTRIYKLDTKARELTGPIILVNSRFESSYGATALDATKLNADDLQRQQEAIDWQALR